MFDTNTLQEIFHDVLNLTTGTQLGLGVLRKKLKDDSDLLPLVKMSESHILRANVLLRNLLDCGGTPHNPTVIDIEDLIKEITNSYRFIAESNKIRLVLKSQKLKVFADPITVTRVLDNLISNAMEHSKNGTVTVEVKSENSRCKIKISDTGIGINENDLQHVFKPYWKKNKVRGRGLGLHIVNNFVKINGGTISVKSTLNRGTTFEFDLPLQKSL
jgi:signal transduction histidine kinase